MRRGGGEGRRHAGLRNRAPAPIRSWSGRRWRLRPELSIPRDTLAAIPEFGNDKINAAYRFGGAPLMVETVEQLLGIELNHVAIVDFAGFRDLIDSLGGIDIELDRPVCNEISGGTFKINFDEGEVNLNGEKALALARTADLDLGEPINDLDRTQFQQLIIQGMKDRPPIPCGSPSTSSRAR